MWPGSPRGHHGGIALLWAVGRNPTRPPFPPATPFPLPSLKLQWACVSARWQRAMCQEIIAIKNSLGFILFFLGSVWALCFLLKKLPNCHRHTVLIVSN